MSIGALRMYRGLMDSAALNGSLAGVVGFKEEMFARPAGCQEQDSAPGAMLDPKFSTSNPGRITVLKRQDVESFGSETA